MNNYIQLVEQEIFAVKAAIDRHKGVGCYLDNCWIWQQHLFAYQKILGLMIAEARKTEDSHRT